MEIHPPVLRNTSAQLRTEANKVQGCIDEVDSIIKSLGSSVFAGNRADAVRSRYTSLRASFYNFKPFLEKFALELDDAANRFEAADRTK